MPHLIAVSSRGSQNAFRVALSRGRARLSPVYPRGPQIVRACLIPWRLIWRHGATARSESPIWRHAPGSTSFFTDAGVVRKRSFNSAADGIVKSLSGRTGDASSLSGINIGAINSLCILKFGFRAAGMGIAALARLRATVWCKFQRIVNPKRESRSEVARERYIVLKRQRNDCDFAPILSAFSPGCTAQNSLRFWWGRFQRGNDGRAPYPFIVERCVSVCLRSECLVPEFAPRGAR